MTEFMKPLRWVATVALSAPLFAMDCAGPEHQPMSHADGEPSSLEAAPHAAADLGTAEPSDPPPTSGAEATIPVAEAPSVQDVATATAQPSTSGAQSGKTPAQADPEAAKQAIHDQLLDMQRMLADPDNASGSVFDDVGPSPQEQDLLDQHGPAEVPAEGDPGSLQAP